MQDPSAHSPGPLSPLPPTSVGEISIPPPSDDIEEMLPVGFSELDAIAASPVPDVELLPPPPTTNSNSRPSSPSLSSYMPAADGYSDRSTADSSTLPEASDQDHDLTTFDVEKGFWRVYHGARELLKYATIYQEHRDSSMRSYLSGDRKQAISVDRTLIPKEIDLESMTQLSWGVTRAVADINSYVRRMHMLSASRQKSRRSSPRPHSPGNRDPQARISKKRKMHRDAFSRGLKPQQQITAESGSPMSQYNVCKDCGTFHSPQWRYGPEGLLNLCNVCGLLHAKKRQRQKKMKVGAK